MEGYFKRFFIGHLLVLLIVTSTILYFDFDKAQEITLFLFAGSIEFLFYYLDAKYLPKRRAELSNELIKIFKAERLSEGVLKFKMGTIGFFVKIDIDFKQGLQLANTEIINFHIPKNQIMQSSTKPELKLMEDNIDGIPTYSIYQTSRSGLKLAKENLEKMVKY